MHNRQLILPFLILTAVAVADQISKIWAVKYLENGITTQVIGQFFQLKLVYNSGGALGTDLGSNLFYLISSLLIIGFVIYFTISNRNIKMIALPLAAIAGGAVGNILDRLRLGKVVDFLDFDFFNINILGLHVERWWTFNLADAAITIGVAGLLVYILFYPKPSSDTSELADNES